MATAEYAGKTIELDADEHLANLSDWSEDVAKAIAEEVGIFELTEDHWKVIEYVKDYYQTYGIGPPVVKIGKRTGLSAKEICELFPCGTVKGAYRLAGLPRPPGCA